MFCKKMLFMDSKNLYPVRVVAFGCGVISTDGIIEKTTYYGKGGKLLQYPKIRLPCCLIGLPQS